MYFVKTIKTFCTVHIAFSVILQNAELLRWLRTKKSIVFKKIVQNWKHFFIFFTIFQNAELLIWSLVKTRIIFKKII